MYNSEPHKYDGYALSPLKKRGGSIRKPHFFIIVSSFSNTSVGPNKWSIKLQLSSPYEAGHSAVPGLENHMADTSLWWPPDWFGDKTAINKHFKYSLWLTLETQFLEEISQNT